MCQPDNGKRVSEQSFRLCFKKIEAMTKNGTDLDATCGSEGHICDDSSLLASQQAVLSAGNGVKGKTQCIHYYWALQDWGQTCRKETEAGMTYSGKAIYVNERTVLMT
jgi:hypothetical protein